MTDTTTELSIPDGWKQSMPMLEGLPVSDRCTEVTVQALAGNASGIHTLLTRMSYDPEAGREVLDPDTAGLQFLRTRPAVELDDLAVVAGHLGMDLVETCARDARSVRITTGGPAPTPAWFSAPVYAPPPAIAIPDLEGPDPAIYAVTILETEDLDEVSKTLAFGWAAVLELHAADGTSDDAHRAGMALCSNLGCRSDHGSGRAVYPCSTRMALANVIPE